MRLHILCGPFIAWRLTGGGEHPPVRVPERGGTCCTGDRAHLNLDSAAAEAQQRPEERRRVKGRVGKGTGWWWCTMPFSVVSVDTSQRRPFDHRRTSRLAVMESRRREDFSMRRGGRSAQVLQSATCSHGLWLSLSLSLTNTRTHLHQSSLISYLRKKTNPPKRNHHFRQKVTYPCLLSAIFNEAVWNALTNQSFIKHRRSLFYLCTCVIAISIHLDLRGRWKGHTETGSEWIWTLDLLAVSQQCYPPCHLAALTPL